MAGNGSINFEVYYVQNGRWQLHANYSGSKRDDAVEDAKRLEKEANIEGCCVVREKYDTKTNESTESVIYHSPKLKTKPNIGSISGGKSDSYLKSAPEGSAAANAAKEARKKEEEFLKQQQQAQDERKAGAPMPPIPPPPSRGEPPPDAGIEVVKVAVALLSACVGSAVVMTLTLIVLHMLGTAFDRNVLLSILGASGVLTFLVIFVPMMKKILANARFAESKRRTAAPKATVPPMPQMPAASAKGGGRGPDTKAGSPVAQDGAGQSSATSAGGSLLASAEGAPEDAAADEGSDKLVMTPTTPVVDEETEPDSTVGAASSADIISFPGPTAGVGGEAASAETLSGPEPMDRELRRVVEEAQGYLGKTLLTDAYLRFGIILFLAGFAEPMTLCFRVRQKDSRTVLTENVARLGVEEAQAKAFCHNIDEYLLDERYYEMYAHGRSGANRRIGQSNADSSLRDAIKRWRSPSQKKAKTPSDGQQPNVDPKVVPSEGGEEKPSSSFVAVMFTDIVNSTEEQQTKGDEWLMKVVRAHNDIVREAIDHFHGREIKHTGDGIMASFNGVSDAVAASLSMQRGFRRFSEAMPDLAFAVRAGISAGEPIHENGDIFGTPVNLAARVMNKAQGGEVAVSSIVREMCRGKDFVFRQVGSFELKGFDEPQPVFHVQVHPESESASKENTTPA